MKRDNIYAHLLAFWAYLRSMGYVVNDGRITNEPASIVDINSLIEGYLSALEEINRGG